MDLGYIDWELKNKHAYESSNIFIYLFFILLFSQLIFWDSKIWSKNIFKEIPQLLALLIW